MKHLILIDTYAVYFKSYFAFIGRPLTNSKGQNTSMLFGFFNVLHRLVQSFPEAKIILALDSKGPTKRHEQYEAYKANRPPAPEDLVEQLKTMETLYGPLGLPAIAKSGYEADDIIASYVIAAKKSGYQIDIYSSDKDLVQLLDENTRLMQVDKQGKGFVYQTLESIPEKWGIACHQIGDLLALMGDSSDNIPGVKGVGLKTAAKLLNEFGSLRGIYDHIDEVKGAVQKKLIDDKENAFLSRQLVELEYAVPNLPELETIEFKAVNDEARELIEKWELKTVFKRFGLDRPAGAYTLMELPSAQKKKALSENTEPEIKDTAPKELKKFQREVIDEDSLNYLVKILEKQKLFCFDLETTSLDARDAELVAAVFALEDGRSFFFQCKTSKSDWSKTARTKLKPVLENETIKKIGHNLKYEYMILKEKGVILKGMHFDTMLAAYLEDSNRSHYNLEGLVMAHFQVEKTDYKSMMGKRKSILELEEKELEDYTFSDGEFTWRLYDYYRQALSKEEQSIFEQIEMPLLRVLAEVEMSGVLLDRKFLSGLLDEFQSELVYLERKIQEEAGQEFNVNSTKQLQKVLFEDMGIKPIKKTKTGFSTDITVLEKLAKQHPIAEYLLRNRLISKLEGTYVRSLPELIHPKTDRVHTNYNQAVAATGRLSSNQPNLQNIPIKVPEGRQIRRAFIAPEGMKMASIDYSQVELRILAQMSGDERLKEAYLQDRDIHRETAKLIFEKEDIDDDERRIAKTINFSVMYGISAHSLSEDLSVSMREAQSFIDAYFAAYYRVREYMEEVLESARENSYVSTHYGRKRPTPDIGAKNFFIRSRAERMAFNTVIQGTASDVIKLAMIEVQEAIEAGSINAEMVMQVHDELVFYLPEESAIKEVEKISLIMKGIKPFDKILDVGASIGECWEK